MPPSTLAMSMYSDAKYLDSSPKSYLDRSYLDSAKAYFEQSKLYMDQQQKPGGLGDYNLHSSGYEPNKLYDESSPVGAGGGSGSLSRSPVADSPDGLVSKTQNSSSGTNNSGSTGNNDSNARNELGSSSASSSTSTSSPGASSLPSYYPGAQSGLLGQRMGQYPGYQTAPGAPGNEFRRPLTVIFWPDHRA